MRAALEIKNLSKQFEGAAKPALKDINIKIMPGKMTGLVGPDGAGKTTLSRIIVGLMNYDHGEVSVFNENKKSHEIGYMPQKFGLYEDLTVIENLNFYADLRSIFGVEREKRFTELLDFTNLKSFQNRLAGKLSGGMKQKLGLACSLLGAPSLLILDEPSVGVDPISRRELWSMVKGLLDDGMAVLWSTSYLDEAEKCDEVILINEGEVLFNGPPQKILENIQGRSYLLKGIAKDDKRRILLECLSQEELTDGVIQGDAIRLVFAKNIDKDLIQSKFNYGGILEATKPLFEDAFVDILGGGPGGYSALAQNITRKPDDGNAVIVSKSLTKTFGDFTAVKDNSFEVQRGEIFGLLGPNGAGKSTTFKMMCGLLQPSSGESFISGLNLKIAASEARAKLGYMAQKFSLYGSLNLIQNLEFFSGVYGLSGKEQKEKIDMMIEVFDFKNHLEIQSSLLPLGFKQRLALACSVMHEPDVLFLDEPTSGVDPITRREFWTHINALVEKGITVMVTTHFMDEAEYCDKIGLIYKGQNIATGSPEDLKEMVKSKDLQNPTLEEAFIHLVQNSEHEDVQ